MGMGMDTQELLYPLVIDMDSDTTSFLIWVIIGIGIGVSIWVIHLYIPSATDLIKSIKFPSLFDILKP